MPPSWQMTPISGFGPQPSGAGHGVVLGGGTQAVFHAQGASFSLPHVFPRKRVPDGHTSLVGATPHSESAHCRKLTELLSVHPQSAGSGLQLGLAIASGASPHAVAVQGAVNVTGRRFGWGCG